jgi:glycosyltransferase involved in cell wall biosynthesis
MRIAQCLEYPIDRPGGTEVLVRELIAGFGPQHEIVLVSRDDANSWRTTSVASFITEQISWNPDMVSVQQARTLAARLRDLKVDLAHFHFGGTYAWGSRQSIRTPAFHLGRLGIPCVVTNHGVFGILDGYLGEHRSSLLKVALLPAAWAGRLQLIRACEAEVAVSQHDYHTLRRRFWPVRGKFRQIYHSRLHGLPPAQAAERSKHIVCVGTIAPRKGQPFLTEAFCRIAPRHIDWKLVLIGRHGDDAMTEQIESLRREHKLGERILMLGSQPDAEVNRWLQTSAIFAMPSVAEGLGLSLQEALFHGCACVTSRAGGTQDLIQHEENGLMVEAADVQGMAQALDRLMSDEALRQRFGARGPASVLEREMTAEKMVAKYVQLYESILTKKSCTARPR